MILHLCKMKGLSGCEKQLLALLPALRAAGWDCRLEILEERRRPVDEVAGRFADAGVPVERIPMGLHGGPALVRRLARRFRELRPALLHTHLVHADLNGAAAALLAGVPRLVSTRHGTHPFYESWPLRWLDRWAARRCDAAVAISVFARQFFIEHRTFPADRLRVIYYGVDGTTPADPGPWRARGQVTQSEIVVGTIGRLIPGKGQEVVLEAAARMNQVGLRWWIIGDGPERGRLEARAERLGLAGRVTFWGFQEDIPGLLAAMDIVCVPTSPRLREGLNLVLLEAGLAAKPVVASRMGPFPEVVADGETGLLVTPDDPDALAAAVGRLAADARLRTVLGAAARRRVRGHFSLARTVAAYGQLYRELGLVPVGGRPPHASSTAGR